MDSDIKKYEKENLTGVNERGPVENVPVRRLTATSILGDKVESNQGEKLGRISDLMVNTDTGEIEYAVLEFKSGWGFGGKLFAIPFSEMFLDEEKKVFTIDREKEYLKNIPGVNKNHWPGTNDHRYFDYVNNYWKGTIQEEAQTIKNEEL